MSKSSFDFSRFAMAAGSWKEPRVIIRAALGVLLLANVVAACFAFHLFGNSAESTALQLEVARKQVSLRQNQLSRSKILAAKVDTARIQGDQFLASYLTPRRGTYSTILSELSQNASKAGLKPKGESFTLDPIEGSDTLSQMTMTANYEGSYTSLVKFINLLDKSPRFLILETLTAVPQASGVLSINVKVNNFVRDDTEGFS